MSLSFVIIKLLTNLRHKLHLFMNENIQCQHVTTKQLGATGIL